MDLYTSASAPWVICTRFCGEKGGGGVCSGKAVWGVGGGSMGGTGAGSVIVCAGEEL